MKRTSIYLATIALFTFGYTNQSRAGLGLEAGVDGTLVLPTGEWGDAAGLGLGGFAKVGFEVIDDLMVTLRLGYIYYLEEITDVTSSSMPIMVGAKYNLPLDLFVEASLGVNRLAVDAGGTTSDDWKFGLLAGAGWSIMGLDLGARLYVPDAGEFDIGLMFTVGFSLSI